MTKRRYTAETSTPTRKPIVWSELIHNSKEYTKKINLEELDPFTAEITKDHHQKMDIEHVIRIDHFSNEKNLHVLKLHNKFLIYL